MLGICVLVFGSGDCFDMMVVMAVLMCPCSSIGESEWCGGGDCD